jgi:uncharacterized protein
MKKHRKPISMIDKNIEEILFKANTIAIVGCSSNRHKDSNRVARFLQEIGYEIIPVNPNHDHILGVKTYQKVGDIEKKIDIVNIFRPGPECTDIVRECLVLRPNLIWMQSGIINVEAQNIAVAHKTCVIMDKCIKVEIKKLKYKHESTNRNITRNC